MTFPKYERWLLISAAALALPAFAVTWWMITPDAPQDAAFESENALSDAGPDPTGDSMQGSAPQATQRADGTAQANADANDFQQYAQTLRTQGQPEQTVRELVSSRITAAFQVRRAAIRNQSRRDGTAAADLDAKLDALNREQDAHIAHFAAPEEMATVQTVTGTQTAGAETSPAGAEKQILAPAVMAEAMPATVKTEEQAADWERLRSDFIKAIGGENQDPANPHYRQRWVQAQSEADQRYRFLFGDSAYVAMQMKAQHEATRQQQGLAK